ncbi:uncharacterized protein LOC105919651 isoform X3 [Fundulus heteroclitus]|uniref:uncharacterized protein LOC105919651 isoform X3 n=1 Tax=Fundulus heteroclitus TaxID=8078 RepID=UPI00165B9C9B|nr:uncharacterized protein LOC105919651 isoform X3 [Fundulus heteroclitus]
MLLFSSLPFRNTVKHHLLCLSSWPGDYHILRSFPGFFKRKAVEKHGNKKQKAWKGFDMAFFLLSDKAETTPTTQDELELLQAGLGKRTLTISKDFSHEELSTLLESTYPKMTSLEGGWLLYKAAGGHGRRRMTAVALESEGYTGSVLRSASSGGKFMLYIAPLQEKIEMTPLPMDAPEFSLMPKATCTQCKMVMPLQMLALHVQGDCEGTSRTTLCDSEQEDEELDSIPVTSDIVPSSNKQNKIICPICNKYYPIHNIEFHASICGESYSPVRIPDDGPESPHDLQEPTQHPIDDISCEEDVLRWVDSKVERSKTFDICVSRDNMLERGLKLWQRQKTGGPANELKITFIGEAGIDTGALRKEFLSEMVAGIEVRLFEGGEKGKIPKYSITDLDKNYFKVAGEIFAVSLGQGGPPPRFLQEWCYQFLVTGTLKDITKENVYDAELSTLIEKIENATDVTQYTEEILNCGYTGPITLEHQDSIVRAVLLHATTKRIPMLQQLREGLELYQLLSVMQKKPKECRNLFVIGDDDKVDSHYIISSLAPVMSDTGSLKHKTEAQILDFFQDFLLDLEDGDASQTEEEDNGSPLSVPRVMQWLTGQAHRHLLVSERETFKIKVLFDHTCLERMPKHTVCYPVVSACSTTITFPTVHLKDSEAFNSNLEFAIRHGSRFDRV